METIILFLYTAKWFLYFENDKTFSLKTWLTDRVKVYQTLNDNGIETPRYIVCDRSDLDNMPEFEEFDDYLEINGETFHKVTTGCNLFFIQYKNIFSFRPISFGYFYVNHPPIKAFCREARVGWESSYKYLLSDNSW